MRIYETHRKRHLVLFAVAFAILLLIVLGAGYLLVQRNNTSESKKEGVRNYITYDGVVTENEEQAIEEQLNAIMPAISEDIIVSVKTSISVEDAKNSAAVYVPVTDKYSVLQNITAGELEDVSVLTSFADGEKLREELANTLEIDMSKIQTTDLQHLPKDDSEIVFIPVNELTPDVKLLSLNGEYYLDSFTDGALFREVVLSSESDVTLLELQFETLNEDTVFKANLTGVTALTRGMQEKLKIVKDPLFFSANIGDFLADADLTHVSNEVSFKENCAYSRTLFCSPPEFIETLKASGVNLVELTGNHNNDLGSEYNTQTINLYRELGWGTVGGGLNIVDAAKPFISTKDGSTVGFLAYNFPDSPTGGTVAGAERAGANSFDFARIETDIASLQETTDFVIVSVQYWECYAYPNGYIEFPECDVPIGEQEANFKKLVDLGADMVIGSSAHQPQTWEFYKDKPIYYGLGNLYFDQTQWPGTERGIVVSSYFVDGKLVQNKLTPTVMNKDFQPRVMTETEATYLLTRLKDAR